MDPIAKQLLPFRVPIDDLAEDPNNPRRGDDETVIRSLRRFGQRFPILYRRDEQGSMIVIAGNTRLRAARSLGWSDIAAVDADDLTDDEARSFALADNRTSDLAAYDDDMLAEILRDLVDGDPTGDLLDSSGYSLDFIDDLMHSLEPPSLDDLGEKHNDGPKADAFWPTWSVRLPITTFQRWQTAWEMMAEDTDEARIDRVIDLLS